MKTAAFRVALTTLLVVTAWVGLQFFGLMPGPLHRDFGDSLVASASAQAAPNSQDFASAVRQVANQVKPAEVQITTSRQTPGSFSQSSQQPTGIGSGVIYDKAGYILTNAHVVAEATHLTVALPDGRTFDGKLVGTDPQTDLAVVQIQGSDLPVAQLGNSGQLRRVTGWWRLEMP